MNSPAVRSPLRSLLPVLILSLCLVGPAVPTAYGETLRISVSGSRGGTLGFGDEDIVSYETTSGSWILFFDGSDVGLVGADVSAFAMLGSSVLIAVAAPTTLPGLGQITPSDLARFDPTSLGSNTSGSWSTYFDGSDVGLQRAGIDALEVLDNGDLIISTSKSVEVSGIDADVHDLLRFTPTSLGPNTAGSWQMYFDGSDADLGPGAAENTSAVAIDSLGDLYFSTGRGANLPGLRTFGRDVLRCVPLTLGSNSACAWSQYWSLPEVKGNSVVIDGLDR